MGVEAFEVAGFVRLMERSEIKSRRTYANPTGLRAKPKQDQQQGQNQGR
jgi:hypothetical protein